MDRYGVVCDTLLVKTRLLTKLSLKVSVLVMCHTRELAFQISKEYERFSKFLSNIKVRIFAACSVGSSLIETKLF